MILGNLRIWNRQYQIHHDRTPHEKDGYLVTLGAQFRKARESMGFSQTKMAGETVLGFHPVSSATISNLERGREGFPHFEIALSLANRVSWTLKHFLLIDAA